MRVRISRLLLSVFIWDREAHDHAHDSYDLCLISFQTQLSRPLSPLLPAAWGRHGTHLIHMSLPFQLIRELGPLLVLLRLQPQGLAGGLRLLLYSLQLSPTKRNTSTTEQSQQSSHDFRVGAKLHLLDCS